MTMNNTFLSSIKLVTPSEIDAQKQWITDKIQSIGEEKLRELTAAAMEARKNAYQPYSNYSVGVAVLCSSGNIYAAPNTEVVSYSQTGHSEHNAINKAISEGEAKNGRIFVEAVMACHDGWETCGACRQEIAEHCDNALILGIDPNGNPVSATSLAILLPFAFTPKNLGK